MNALVFIIILVAIYFNYLVEKRIDEEIKKTTEDINKLKKEIERLKQLEKDKQ